MALTWLKGDLHCHCERHELLPALLDGVPARLDFLALTNHPHKPIFAEQAAMLARARAACPTVALFFGVEWNGLGGRHTNLIFPPSSREADHAAAFLQAHDFVLTGREPDLPAAFAQLRALPDAERPLVFINHPSTAVGFTPEHLDQLHAAAGVPGLWIGMEALHGHQAWPHVLADDPAVYPASRLGGLCDHQYTRGRACTLLADSDFHVHKQASKPDYPPGVFQHTRVAVDLPANPGDKTAAIFAALRAGATCVSQGFWCNLTAFIAADRPAAAPRVLRPGDSIDSTRAVALRVEFDAAEPIGRIEALGVLTPGTPPAVLFQAENLPVGRGEVVWTLPPGAQGYLRLRLTAARNHRPPVPGMTALPPPPAPRLLLTSALWVAPGDPRR